jgi:hypothetical protein
MYEMYSFIPKFLLEKFPMLLLKAMFIIYDTSSLSLSLINSKPSNIIGKVDLQHGLKLRLILHLHADGALDTLFLAQLI